MIEKFTPTLLVCVVGILVFTIALARPGSTSAPVAQSEPAAEPTAAPAPTAAPVEPVEEPEPESEAPAPPKPAAEAPEETPTEAPVPPPAPVAEAIEIEGFAYNAVTAAPGATVDVQNLDGATHTVTANDDSFDTGNISGNGSGTLVAPTAPGAYPYFCAIHPSMMGTLTVS